ncbi:hypothetical protein [Psychrobacter sp. I-STPA10]|uniref:hypothetical protein n=1 Tax=Psychrobacter sp. I-STPA10 TaxID=2585769 RepID=UPI001E4CC757|nr:hypothetical protein [Psychrobacter sp. I-STPA10]
MQNRFTQNAIITMIVITFALTGCSTTGVNNNAANNGINTASNIGMNIFKVAIDNKCRSELSQHKAWRIARMAMTQNQENVLQNKICGCVSEQAPQHITFNDMAQAIIDSEYRTKLATKVVVKSLQSCYGSFMQ